MASLFESYGIADEPAAAPVSIEPTGFARTQGDRALALGQGVVGGVKMLSDLAGPDNAVSQALGKANEGMQGLYSPARAAEMKNRQALIEEADASGSTMNQITSRLGGIAEAPLQTTLQAAGSMAPNIAAAIATGGVSTGPSVLATAARIGLPAALGVGMGVGSVKGQNYDAVLQKAKQEGMTDEQAQALAVQASEYSAQNAPQQALGGAFGALDSLTGAERIISGMARKGVTAAPAHGMARRIASGGVEEAIPEGMQGAQGQYAQNEAMNNASFKVDPWAGVAGQGVNDAVVGAMIGGPTGAMNGNRSVPEVGPLSRAANTGIAITPPPAVPAPTIPMAPEQEQSLLAHANQRAQELTNKANGTKDAKTNAPDGTPVTIPGQIKQFLTPAEKDEQAFLAQSGGDAQALAGSYPGLLEQPAVEQVPVVAPEVLTAPPPPASPAELPKSTAEAFGQRERDRPAPPTGAVMDGDILNTQGKPFTTMPGAMTAQRKACDTHEIVRVAGGLVVRAKETTDGAIAADGGLVQGAHESTGDQPGGSGVTQLAEPVRGQPGDVQDNAGPAASSGPAAPVPLPGGDTAAVAVAGKKIDHEWTAFSKESGTLGKPRAEMPQIKAEHRGAMVNFLNARGIAHEQEEVPASSLKPTQAEFSPAKVEKALAFEGGDRSILVSSDNHVLDGHHQWVSKLQGNESVKVIRLDAPIHKLLDEVSQFPSAEVSSGAESGTSATASALPAHLAGAKPRYSYGAKQFALNFASDIDRASYIAAQATPSKRDAEYVAYVMQATGMTESEVRAHGQTVRNSIKAQAKDAVPGLLQVAQVPVKTTQGATHGTQAAETITPATQQETPERVPGPKVADNPEWTRMPHAERLALTTRTGMAKMIADKIARTAWADITPKMRERITNAFAAAPAVEPVATADQTDGKVQSVIDSRRKHGASGQDGEDADKIRDASKPAEPAEGEGWDDLTPEQKTDTLKRSGWVTAKGTLNGVGKNLLTKPWADITEVTRGKISGNLTPVAVAPVEAPAAPMTQEPAKEPEVPATPAPEAVQAAPKPKSARAKIEQARQARADYFTPGNIVTSYGGHDEVLSYTPTGVEGSGWSVKVRAVVKQNGKWVPDPKDNRERSHSTQPDARKLASGPVERAQAPNQAAVRPGEEVNAEDASIVEAPAAQYTAQDGQVNEPTQPDDGAPTGAAGSAAIPLLRRPDTPLQRRTEIVGLGIAADIQRAGSTALVGRTVEGHEQLAELAQVYRDPRYETFRVFFTKGGSIVHATGVSSRLPGQAPMVPVGMSNDQYIALFKSEMARTGADGYYILHNHPSGNPKPSDADVNLTEYLAAEVPGMIDHVIINSNKYAVITPGKDVTIASLSQVVTREFGEDKLLQASKPMAAIGRSISGPDELAIIGKSTQRPGWITLVGIGSDNKVRVIAEAPSHMLTRSSPYLAGSIRRLMRQSGSSMVFAVGEAADINSTPIKRAVDTGILTDAVPYTGESLATNLPSNPLNQTKGKVVAATGPTYGGDASGMKLDQVQSITDAIKARWANAPQIVVAANMADTVIPQTVRDYDQKQKSLGATGEPEGFVDRGKVYLVADQLATPSDVMRVLFHEALGHMGLRGVFGDKLKPLLTQLAALRRDDIAIKARQYGLIHEDSKPEDSNADIFSKMTTKQRLEAAEEVLAELAQTHPELGYVKRAIAAIRAWLRANVPGFGSMKLTDADIIAQFILPARRHIEGKGAPEVGKELGTGGTSATQPAFSRASIAAYTQHATDRLNETFSHPGKLSLWDKTVGSMYHLAERSPPFKRVFDAAQSFIQDVSYYATEAADMAPKILPKLDTWKDMLKTPVSAADNKAISKPILEGTLSWARDEDGKPVRMDELEATYEQLSDEAKAQMLLKKLYVTPAELKQWKASPIDVYQGAVKARFEAHFLTAGVVWKDAELQSMFNLNPAQIGLYHEFRAATDQSLDNLTKADLLRFGGKDVEHLKDMVMEVDTVDEAALMLRDYLHSQRDLMPERVDDLTAAAGGMIERADKVAKLKKQGYAPLSRFGRYSVDVVVGGERQYFSLFESARAANLMAVKLKSEYGAANVAQGTMSQKEFEMFQGITPESLELFGNMLGLDSKGNEAQDKAFQTYLKLTKTNRSAMKRMIHRKGTEGFSEDMGRVLAAFVYSNARQTSAALHMGELGDSVQAIPKGQGELKDAALELSDYIKKPREEAQALRGLLFAQYLGGSFASAFVNFTQPLTVSFPYLSQYGGATKAGAALIQAMKDQRAGKVLEAGLKEALHQAEEEGTVSPQSVHELMAQAQGRAALNSGDGTKTGDALALVQNNFSKLALGWGKLFGFAEQVNRRSTFIAAYRLGVEKKMADPGAFAIKAVHETQFISNKANKAKFARGAIGATLMTFKSYSTNYLELLHRMATRNGPEGKKAAALMLGMLFLMAGAGGLPFADDLDTLADFFAQRLGYNFSSKKAKQEFLEGLFGKAMADFIGKGISGLPGSPVDTAGRMSMGHLAPGLGLLLKKRDHTGDVQELFGPAGDLVKRTFQAGDKAASGDLIGAAKAIAPKAVYNALKGKDMAMTGAYNDDRGFKVIETTPFEAAMKAIGFQPESVAEVQQANYLHQRAKDFYSQNAHEINAKWARGLYEKDPAQVDDARAMVKNWNENNPEQRITANMPAILKQVREMRKPKDQRIADTAPKSMRAEMRRETAQARADAM